MSNFRVNFENPWLLLLLIPAAVLTIVLYLRLNKKYRRNRNRIVSIILHSIVMLLCISVLAGITFAYEKVNKENEIIILVDVSESSEENEDEKNEYIRSIIQESSARFKLGIVTFGYDQVYAAPLTYDTEELYNEYARAELPDTSATDIASALKYSATLFNNPQAAKIVLLSDGVETDEKALNCIKAIAAEGIRVDTVYFENEKVGNEVQVISAEKPDYTITVGNPFKMSVTLQSSYEGLATITMIDNDEADESVNVVLLPGTQTFELDHTFLVPGMHIMEFRVEALENDGDSLLNNSFYSYINLETYDHILIIERTQNDSEKLKNLINSDNIDVVQVGDLLNMPSTLDELRDYDQVILMNIANADMPEGFDKILNAYVHDIGGGLLTIGGSKEKDGKTVANMYNRQDMYNTLYQEMLPVEAIEYTPPLGVMIVIDRSGSMGVMDNTTGRSKLELAKDGAMACLNALTERDYCGVMTLGSDFTEEASIRPVTQMSQIIAAIDNIKMGGATMFGPAIERAGQALSALTRVEKKHIILVTDGLPGDSFETYSQKIKLNKAAGITMSIVAIGVDQNAAQQMEKAASAEFGDGRFYSIREASNLPYIMREDLKVPEIKEIDNKPFTPKISAHTSVVTGVTQADMPQLDGYYGTKLKEGAEASLSGEYVPIYAQWKYGKGVVGSFMCDLNGTWSSNFMNNPTGARIINNIVGGLFPMENIRAQEIDVRLEGENYSTHMSIDTELDDTQTIHVTVTSPPSADSVEGTVQEFTLDVTNYSRLTFTVKDPGLHTILVEKRDSAGNVLEDSIYETYKTFSYSKEYDLFYDAEAAEEMLTKLAKDGRGNVIEEVTDIFADFVRSIKVVIDPKLAFIITAIVLFLLDVAVRKFKFKWIHEIIRDRKEHKRLLQGQIKE